MTQKELALAEMTAQEYVEAQNERTRAWVAEDPENRWAGELVCDESWTTGLDAARSLAIGELSDAFKEANGFRPRHYNLAAMSLDDIEAELERCHEQAAEELAWKEAEDDMWADYLARCEAEDAAEEARLAEQAAKEAERARVERWMDCAAERGAEGW